MKSHSRIALAAGVAALALAQAPAHAAGESIGPAVKHREQEIARLLRSAEAEFWTLKQRLECERAERALRIAEAKAAYDSAQSAAESSMSEEAAFRAEVALDRYHAELESAMTGVDAARIALDLIEGRVSRYRAELAALRRGARTS
jgi:hypothetical protein